MDFTDEFIQENGLTTEQVTAVSGAVKDHIETQKSSIWATEWSAKATENAEGILNGAVKKTIETTGIPRNDGEKVADYLSRASNLFFEGEKASLERQKGELDKKIKEGGGSEVLKQELESTKEKLKALQEKEAQFADYEENDYKGKLEEANQSMSKMQQRIAFNSVKPTFPSTANAYEVKSKWADCQKKIQEKYNIVLDEDNEPWGVDKENEFKKFKLSELVAKDEDVAALTEGRQQKGPGAKTGKPVKIEGVPFEVPENATPVERQKAVRDYLASQSISKTSPEYAKQFSELNAKILGETPAKK